MLDTSRALPVWSTACPDWERRIVARESLVPTAPLFPTESEAALAVFRELRVKDVVGQPPMGEICRPWTLNFVGSVFGACDPDTGRRLIKEFFLLISKKNSKSTTAAGIMLTALIRNWRHSAEFLILAPTIEVANNSFYPARDMVRADEELSDLLHVQDHIRTITHRLTGAMLKVIAAENEAVSGKKATGVLFDELWLFGRQPSADNMLKEAQGGLASRPEGFVIYLSTQADEAPAGVFEQKLSYARKVRDGKIKDSRFLPVIYEFPKQMLDAKEHLNPQNFYITNPNLGASVDEEFLVRAHSIAQEEGETSLRGFLAKHLNVQIGISLREQRWAGADFWEAAADPTLTLESLLERSEVVTIGIDGGGLADMLGLMVLGRETGTGCWLAWARAWIHPIVLDRYKAEAARLEGFARDGSLTIVQRAGDDLAQLGDIVEQVEASGLLDRIGVDPAGIGDIPDEIASRNIEADRIVGIPQGWRMVGSIKTTERRVAEGNLKHEGSALMSWCVGNAKTEPRGNAALITKQASGSAKIDPVMALLDAAALMSMNPQPRKKRYQLFFV